jgi:hypothetical protein
MNDKLMKKEIYYMYDIESGIKYEVTKEQYDSYRETTNRVWESIKPSVNKEIGKVIIGYWRRIKNSSFENLFYSEITSKPGKFTVHDTSKGHCGLCGSVRCKGNCFK